MCGRSSVRESQRPAKSYTALQAVLHCFNIYAGSCYALARRWAQQTRYTLWRNTANIMKGLVLEYLTRNNQGHRQKNFQEEAIRKKWAISHQESLPLLAVAN